MRAAIQPYRQTCCSSLSHTSGKAGSGLHEQRRQGAKPGREAELLLLSSTSMPCRSSALQ